MAERYLLIRETDLAQLFKGRMDGEENKEALGRIDKAVYNPQSQLEFVATTIERVVTSTVQSTEDLNPWVEAARAVLAVPE